MQTLILTLHIIVCFFLVILILLQSGKEGMGVIFGGGNSTVFGSSGAGGILAKLTTLMAIIFVITSLSYTYVTSSHPETESQILNVQIEEVPQAKKTESLPAEPQKNDAVTTETRSESTSQPVLAAPAASEQQPKAGQTSVEQPQASQPKTEEASPAKPAETPKAN